MLHFCPMMKQSAKRASLVCAFLEDTAAKAVSSFALSRDIAIRIIWNDLGFTR